MIGSSGELFLFAPTSTTGTASVSVAVPYQLPLVGAEVFHTWLIADPGAPNNGLGLVSTRSAASIVGL